MQLTRFENRLMSVSSPQQRYILRKPAILFGDATTDILTLSKQAKADALKTRQAQLMEKTYSLEGKTLSAKDVFSALFGFGKQERQDYPTLASAPIPSFLPEELRPEILKDFVHAGLIEVNEASDPEDTALYWLTASGVELARQSGWHPLSCEALTVVVKEFHSEVEALRKQSADQSRQNIIRAFMESELAPGLTGAKAFTLLYKTFETAKAQNATARDICNQNRADYNTQEQTRYETERQEFWTRFLRASVAEPRKKEPLAPEAWVINPPELQALKDDFILPDQQAGFQTALTVLENAGLIKRTNYTLAFNNLGDRRDFTHTHTFTTRYTIQPLADTLLANGTIKLLEE